MQLVGLILFLTLVFNRGNVVVVNPTKLISCTCYHNNKGTRLDKAFRSNNTTFR